MQKRACFVAVSLLCLLPTHTVWADARAEAKEAIQAAYNRYADAVASDDVDGVFTVKAPGFISVAADGTVTQRSDADERQHYVELMTPPNKRSHVIKVLSLELHSNQAIVTDQDDVTGVKVDPSTGQLVAFHVVESDRDFWIKSGGSWRWKRSRTLTLTRE